MNHVPHSVSEENENCMRIWSLLVETVAIIRGGYRKTANIKPDPYKMKFSKETLAKLVLCDTLTQFEASSSFFRFNDKNMATNSFSFDFQL
ncbi:hypothetical protein G9A89_010218 [Geosiphon pyriformis]|nr:hypothetical protein G9A89_010218 [Geosiphon pyriformis]